MRQIEQNRKLLQEYNKKNGVSLAFLFIPQMIGEVIRTCPRAEPNTRNCKVLKPLALYEKPLTLTPYYTMYVIYVQRPEQVLTDLQCDFPRKIG